MGVGWRVPIAHREWLRLFSTARVILAPMGAAEVLALAAPTGSCLVELQESTWRARTGQLLPRSDDTYARLARAMAIQYVRVKTINLQVNASQVAAGLACCGHAASCSHQYS